MLKFTLYKKWLFYYVKFDIFFVVSKKVQPTTITKKQKKVVMIFFIDLSLQTGVKYIRTLWVVHCI